MDGQLRIFEEEVDERPKHYGGIVETMDSKYRHKMRMSEMSLGTWEIKKRPIAGCVEVTTAVPNLGKFA